MLLNGKKEVVDRLLLVPFAREKPAPPGRPEVKEYLFTKEWGAGSVMGGHMGEV